MEQIKKPRSAYMVVAQNHDKKPKDLRLDDILMLAKGYQDQLKFIVYIDFNNYKEDKPIVKKVDQLLAYFSIKDTDNFYAFLKEYVNLTNRDVKKGRGITKKLKKNFIVYDNYDDAEKERLDLLDKQDKYFDSLPEFAKGVSEKTTLLTIDLYQFIAKYIEEHALKEFEDDPVFKNKLAMIDRYWKQIVFNGRVKERNHEPKVL